jgi:CheY-like chemotaxis protein
MRRRNILVVEDQAILAMTLGDLLGSLGYRVVGPATSLPEALALLEAGQVDGALLDRDLGGQSSLPLATQLLARGIPFAWATGSKMKAPHGMPVLRKPFTVAELQTTLGQMFDPRVPA